MNIVQSGNTFQVYGEAIHTYQKLPAASYTIEFHQLMGFSLAMRSNLTVSEEKVYGSIPQKVKKILTSYNLLQRNLGVLLSGTKGIGKSLFVRLLSEEAIKNSLPVVLVDHAYPNIANFIASIQQDCIIIFDEFEKIFCKNEEYDPQNELLSLFDGTDGGHKLFIVTCNNLKAINQYMLNRPGRFHYHFALTPPTAEEVREYMQDKLKPEYHKYIEDIVKLNYVTDMPYDYLRAIAFELNQGYNLNETMSDLNITQVDKVHYDLKLYLSNNMLYEAWNIQLDLNSSENYHIWFYRNKNSDKTLHWPDTYDVDIIPRMAHLVGKEYIINEHIETPKWDESDFPNAEDPQTLADKMNAVTVNRIVLTRVLDYGPARYLV